MNVSEHYKRAARVQRLANKPAILRAALHQASPQELAALDAITARADAIARRVQHERTAERRQEAARNTVQPQPKSDSTLIQAERAA